MTTLAVSSSSQTLSAAIELIWREATLLDRKQYGDWLELWEPSGWYIVPIDPDEVNFEDSLNYVYDDHNMLQKRVDRMMAGTAGSVIDSARTVRTVSRFVQLPSQDEAIVATQIPAAYKRGTMTIFAARDLFDKDRRTGTAHRAKDRSSDQFKG